MKLKTTLLVTILVFALILSACGDGESSPGNDGAIPTDTSSPTPSPTPVVIPPELDDEVGQKWIFRFLENETEFGSYEYQLTDTQLVEETNQYTYQSNLKLESSTACKDTQFETTYVLTRYGTPVKYNKSGRIGKG